MCSDDEKKYAGLLAARRARKTDDAASSGDDDDENEEEDDDDDEDDEEGEGKGGVSVLQMLEEEEEKARQRLVGVVQGLGSKRKGGDATNDAAAARPEGEFNMGGNGELTLDALMAGLGESGASSRKRGRDAAGDAESSEEDAAGGGATAAALKKKLRGLTHSNKGALSAPLASVVLDRIDRSEAYKAAKDDITKWQSTVKANREAEQLRFPLIDPRPPKASAASMAANFNPSTSMEEEVAMLLETSGMNEKALRAQEDLELNEMDEKEREARKSELSKLRNLLFFYEMKRKRINKIKSKQYRRIRNKQDKRRGDKELEEMKLIDPEYAKSLMMDQETKRSRERMTLKHKNQGKWIKHVLRLNRANKDGSTKEAIQAQLRLHQELMRKMNHTGDSSSDEDSDDDSSMSGDEETREAKATSALWNLTKDLEETTPADEAAGGKGSGLMALKFMQRAAEKKKKELLKELEADKESGAGGAAADAAGRRQFGPKSGDAAAVGSKAGGGVRRRGGEMRGGDGDGGIAVNVQPFEVDQDFISGSLQVNLETDNDKPSKKLSKKAAAAKRKQEQQAAAEAAAKLAQEEADEAAAEKAAAQEADAESSADSSSAAPQAAKKAADEEDEDAPKSNPWLKKGSAVPVQAAPRLVDQKREEDAEAEASRLALLAGGDEEQRELVARAFAAGDDEEEFEKEKRDIVEGDLPEEEKAALPGWGDWTGEGVKKKKATAKEKRRKEELRKARKEAREARKDSALKNVIITEKRDKKLAQHMVPGVPHPFTSREQYEASLKQPLGKEWNTTQVHNKLVKPAVVARMGTIIDPIKLGKKKGAEASKRRGLAAAKKKKQR